MPLLTHPLRAGTGARPYELLLCPLLESSRPDSDTPGWVHRLSALLQPVVAPGGDFAGEVESAAAFGAEDAGPDFLELLIDRA